MRAEIIAIGTEILLGHIVNTNTAYLGRKLAELGMDVYHHTTVGDNHQRLAESIRQALRRADIVIMTGGLGPTVDDITAETLSRIVVTKDIKPIKNRVGTAAGLIVERDNKIIICLPGPPRELEPMFENSVLPYIRKRFKRSGIIKSRTIKMTGLPEISVNNKVKDLLNLKPPATVGIYAKLGEVDLKIMSKAGNEKEALRSIRKIEAKIKRRLGDHIFGYDDETLEGAVAKLLFRKKKTIAVAESCTGGLVSHRLTNVSGSSKYFIMAVVAYSNEIKEGVLGISRRLMARKGAVSKEAALGMATGVRFLACSDIGIGITGIAGPTGGTRSKPVGLVYITLVSGKKRIVKELRLTGSREEIKFQASQVTLDLIRRTV